MKLVKAMCILRLMLLCVLFALTLPSRAQTNDNNASQVVVSARPNLWVKYTALNDLRSYVKPILSLSNRYTWCLKLKEKPESKRPINWKVWLEHDSDQVELALLEDDCVVLPEDADRYQAWSVELNVLVKHRGSGDGDSDGCKSGNCIELMSEVRNIYDKRPDDYQTLWGNITHFPEDKKLNERVSDLFTQKKPFRFIKSLELRVASGTVLRFEDAGGVVREHREQDGWIHVLPDQDLLKLNPKIYLSDEPHYAVVAMAKSPN